MPWLVASAAALVLLTVWLWSPAVHFGFVYDDHAQIETNSHIQSWSNAGQLFQEPLWAQLGQASQSPYYRPLFSVLLLAEYSLFGPSPAAWHAVSIGLHLLVALALYCFLLLRRVSLLAAFVATCLFAVSPLNAEVVNWISGADNALYTLFVLLSLCLLTAAASATSPRNRVSLRCGSAAMLGLALFSKELAIAGLLLCLAYEFVILNDHERVKGLFEWSLYLAPLAIYALARALAVSSPPHGPRPWTTIQVVSTMAAVVLLAAKKLLWPMPASEFYDLWITQPHSALSLAVAASLIVGIILLAWFLARRSRLLAWSLAVVTIPLLPSLAALYLFKEYDLFHDRYLYLSCAGLAMVLAFSLGEFPSRGSARVVVTASLGALLPIYAVAARVASRPYQDDVSFFSNAVKVAPHNVLAVQFLADAVLKLGDCHQALELYSRAAGLRPDLWAPSFYFGIAAMRCGHPSDAPAAFEKAAAASAATSEQGALASYELGRALIVAGNLPGAEKALRQAAIKDPASKKVRSTLARVVEAEEKHSTTAFPAPREDSLISPIAP